MKIVSKGGFRHTKNCTDELKKEDRRKKENVKGRKDSAKVEKEMKTEEGKLFRFLSVVQQKRSRRAAIREFLKKSN